MPVGKFCNESRRQPKAYIIDEHLDRSAFGLGVVDGPIEVHQIAKDDVAPVMVPVLEGVAADAGEEEPEDSEQYPVDG